MKNISKEILLSLRGRISARAFSQKMGYTTNQIGRWESGHSRFSWLDFIDLCRRLNFSIEEALLEYEFHANPENIEQLLNYLVPGKTKKEIAKASGVSLLTVHRWVKKEAVPSTEVIFKLFTSSGTPLSPLLKKLLLQRKMTPRLIEILKGEEDKITTMLETPWTIAIAGLCLHESLQGSSLKASLKQISKKIQLDQKVVTDTILRLIRAKLLGFSSEKNRFYLPNGPAHFEFRDSYLSFVRGAEFWMKYSLAVMANKKTPVAGENHISYLVFNCRNDEVKTIHQKIIRLYKEIADLSQQSEKRGQCDRTFSFCMVLNGVNGPVFGDLIKGHLKKS